MTRSGAGRRRVERCPRTGMADLKANPKAAPKADLKTGLKTDLKSTGTMQTSRGR